MNYDDIKKEISEIDRTIEGLDSQLCGSAKINTGHVDKGGLRFAGCKTYHEPLISKGQSHWLEASVSFGAYHGYYGDSNCSEDMSVRLASYILRSLRVLEKDIINKAVELAGKDKKKIADKAREEAQKILDINKEIK